MVGRARRRHVHVGATRFTYWVRRAARGGRVALPARPDQPVQVLDSRDLATLVVRLITDDRSGVDRTAERAGAALQHRQAVPVLAG